MIAPAREMKKPAPQARVQPWLDGKRRMALEQGFERSANCPRGSQGQHMTRANEAAIGVRATLSEFSPINDRNPPADLRQGRGLARPITSTPHAINLFVHIQSPTTIHNSSLFIEN